MTRKRHKCRRTNRIPSFDGKESISAATRVRTNINVIDDLAPESVVVQQRIEETKPGIFKDVPWIEYAIVINQRDQARHCLDVRGRSAGCLRTNEIEQK